MSVLSFDAAARVAAFAAACWLIVVGATGQATGGPPRPDPVARGVLQDAPRWPIEPLAAPEEPGEASALDTPATRLYYVRSLEVVATYYTPANGGKAPGSIAYGITATGARATRGIVAVDPRVIPLYSWLYVPGYGFAQARDVGGAIIGDHIDVAFDDGDGAWWGRRYLTVYVLASSGSER